MTSCPFTLEEMNRERISEPCGCGRVTVSRLNYINDHCECGMWASYSDKDSEDFSRVMEWLDEQHHEHMEKAHGPSNETTDTHIHHRLSNC